MIENIKHERVKPVADDATILPDGGNAGKPEKHENTSDINWGGYAIVFCSENFNCKINEDKWNEIGGKADTLKNGIVNSIGDSATLTEPSDNEEKR